MNRIKLTKEECHKESLKYNRRGEFSKGSISAYRTAKKNGWLDEICSHIPIVVKPNGYWTKEKCIEIALSCDTYKEFCLNHSALSFCRKNNLIITIKELLGSRKMGEKYWTKERCSKEALKYESRGDYWNDGLSARYASKNDWLDEICSHMIRVGNVMKRLIYAYEFNDNYCYVGLTYNVLKRNKNHFNDTNSSVYKHIINSKLTPELIILTDYIDIEKAIELEREYLIKYKNNGWEILNKNKTGSIGGNILKWTKEKCLSESLKYKSRKEFQKMSGSAYTSSCKNNWLDEICSHMKKIKNENGYWTKEKCIQLSKEFKNITQFRKKYPSAYSSCYKNNWIEEVKIL